MRKKVLYKIVKGGITAAKGFKANGLCCGIKKSGKPDLALMVSDVPATAAAVFTKNSIKAAPLIVSQKHIRNHRIQACVTNSGNANCFTGRFGQIYAEKTTELFGSLLNIPKDDIFVLSTGIIGKPLPYDKIAKASHKLVAGLSQKAHQKAAEAILTTDLARKEVATSFVLNKKKVTIGGCAKGSGMVAPNMATMLGFITTDAAISASMLQKALKIATDQTFNCITIDGCMSTNDTVIALANGLAGNSRISKSGNDFDAFLIALLYVCWSLSRKIIQDAEGATKFLEIFVEGAQTHEQAKKIALQIANSNLVKTAAYGSNPNWGRVAAAVGSLGIKKLSEEKLKIQFSSFKKKTIKIITDLGIGKASAVVYTSDLSHEYIRINGAYN